MDNPKTLYDQLPTYAPNQVGPMLEAMHRDGFVLIKKILNPGEIEIARQKIDRLSPFGWDATGSTDHFDTLQPNRNDYGLEILALNV